MANTATIPTYTQPITIDLGDMPSMDELMGGEPTTAFAQGEVVTGKVVGKRDDGIIVDIGFKSEGFVPKSEFPDWEKAEIGMEVRAVLELLEDEEEDYMPLLSVARAMQLEAWKKFTDTYEEGAIVKGRIKFRVKGGLMVDIGVDAFLPGSQVDTAPVKNMDDFVGNEYEFKVLKINKERQNVVVSRRELLEEEKQRRRAKLMAELLPGQMRKGIVKNITDFGAFVDLFGVDGLIHITDMSWGRISHPSELVQIGQEIESVILDVDRDNMRVSLGLKQKSRDPWESVEQRHPIGSRIKGRVVNVMPYGAFVEIEEGVEGLIHVSEMSWTRRITRASDVLQVNQEVEAVVLDVQPDAKKISLGLRQTMENPWVKAAERYPSGTKIQGKVRNMTSYGAFIEIEEGIDGMVHVSDMSWTRKINNPAELLKRGEDVEAVVLDIDPSQQRISLGIKQLTPDPWDQITDIFHVNQAVHGAVTKLTSFGAFVELDNGIEGLLHISQLSDEPVNKVRDIVKVGDQVEARVIKIDPAERRIGLSIKAARQSDMEPAESSSGSSAGSSKPQGGGDRPTGSLRPGEHMVDVGDVFDTAFEEAREASTDNEP